MKNMHKTIDKHIHRLWCNIESGAAKGVRRYSHPASGNASFETFDALHAVFFELTLIISSEFAE